MWSNNSEDDDDEDDEWGLQGDNGKSLANEQIVFSDNTNQWLFTYLLFKFS